MSETCPKCGAKFDAGEARGGYATMTVFRGGALDTKLRCPECSHVFQPSAAGHVANLTHLQEPTVSAATRVIDRAAWHLR